MSGASITVELEMAAAEVAFARLMALGDDQTPLMTKIGAQLQLHVDERFEDTKGPDGLPWVVSRRAKEQKGQTLTDTSRLRKSITFQADRDSVAVGTNVIYAAIHQFGGTIRAKTEKGLWFQVGTRANGKPAMVNVDSVEIPKRPFLGFNETDREETAHIVAEHLQGLIGGPSA